MKLRKGIEVRDVNLGILVLFKAVGLPEIRERSLVRTVKQVEANPRTVSGELAENVKPAKELRRRCH